MDATPVYVLDSDIFITPARTYYAFDLAPRFWEMLLREAKNGRLLSIDRVKHEIDRGGDELATWANNHFRSWFASTETEAVLAEYKLIIRWATSHQQFTSEAKAEFARANNADAWLVAYAKVNGYTVVTFERYEPQACRRIKIPNVCNAFGVAYVDLFEMLRALRVKID